MNRSLKLLVFALALVATTAALLTISSGELTTPAHASNFWDCVDDCHDEVNACLAACPLNDFRCELECNNAWWACNDVCAAIY